MVSIMSRLGCTPGIDVYDTLLLLQIMTSLGGSLEQNPLWHVRDSFCLSRSHLDLTLVVKSHLILIDNGKSSIEHGQGSPFAYTHACMHALLVRCIDGGKFEL